VDLSSVEPGDFEGVNLTETGFNTGVFVGSIATQGQALAGRWDVRERAGRALEVEHFLPHEPHRSRRWRI